MVEVWEVVEQYGLTTSPAREIIYNPIKEVILRGVMTKLGHPVEKAGCPKCLYDSIKILKRLKKEFMAKSTETDRKYILRDVQTSFKGMRVNRENLTDEIAREMLRHIPGLIPIFAKYPKNWKEDILLKEPEKESGPEEPPTDQPEPIPEEKPTVKKSSKKAK